MERSRLQAIDHVNIEALSGLEGELRWFYGELGKLEWVEKGSRSSGSLAFRSERLELRIRIADPPRIESGACRVTLAIPSLTEAAELLSERRWPFEQISGLRFTERRLATHDPAGNRVEFKQEWPWGVL